MKFYGQKEIIDELTILSKKVLAGNNYNILIKGKSGSGKTTLAKMFLSWIVSYNNGIIILPQADQEFSESFKEKRFIIIDEVHELTKPEWIYPYLDRGDRTFILVTNESGELKEPLVNRCIPLTLKPYTRDELYWIAQNNIKKSIKLTPEMVWRIVEVGKENPRIIKLNICKRLKYVIEKSPESFEEFESYLNKIGYIDGLDPLEKEYLKVLNQLGGVASLTLLCSALHLSRNTLTRDVEPFIVGKYIDITSKGRILK